MTDEERNAAIGALVVEYEENERLIATLRSLFHSIGSDLELLGDALGRLPSEVEATDSEFHVHIGNPKPPVLRTSVSFDNIRDHLDTWHKALANKERLEDCLRQAGLEKLIGK